MTPGAGSRDSLPSDLSDRARRILLLLVREYIERGEPVSSLWLARHGGLRVSSATVRAVMAELERLGYVFQPHTSAGRVPTDRGYRCYVDALLDARRPARLASDVEARLRNAGTVEDVVANVPYELSRVSQHLGFAVPMSNDAVTVRQIDFVGLDRTKVLVVIIAGGGQITHKVVDLGEPAGPVELVEAANYLNAEFSGQPLWRIRLEVLQRLQEERTLFDALLQRALTLARSTFENPAPTSLFVRGASLLLAGVSQGADRLSLGTLRDLFAMIEEKHRLVRLLNEYVEGPGLTIVIGTEHTLPDLQDFSLIASTYTDGRATGRMGVIGPRRMHYSRAITVVDSVSRAVSRVLSTPAPRDA